MAMLMTHSQRSRRCSDSTRCCHSEWMKLGCRKHKADQNKLWLICVVSLWSGGCGEAAENQTESHWFSHDIPNSPPPSSPKTHPFKVRRLACWACTPSHIQTRSSNPEPNPPPRPGDHPLFPYLSLAVSLALSPCLIYAFAEQLLPRELREQHSHLSTLVTRCHLLLPAHRTSRQTMPHAFWTSDLRRLLQRGLGGALDSNSHGWWS